MPQRLEQHKNKSNVNASSKAHGQQQESLGRRNKIDMEIPET
jgi:hypothetical protein